MLLNCLIVALMVLAGLGACVFVEIEKKLEERKERRITRDIW